jgi:ADP-ribose pyrophosphatase YjhB (NUDIX family)
MEPGEDPSETAVHEVREEAGTESKHLSRVGSIGFQHNGEEAHVFFFLLEYIREVPREEQREVRWCTYAEAMKLQSFEDSKRILTLAQAAVQGHFS